MESGRPVAPAAFMRNVNSGRAGGHALPKDWPRVWPKDLSEMGETVLPQAKVGARLPGGGIR